MNTGEQESRSNLLHVVYHGTTKDKAEKTLKEEVLALLEGSAPTSMEAKK